MGIVEVITLMLGLAGFGLQPNPNAPTADQSLQYAMPDADVVVHVDVASIVPGNYKALLALPNQPQIRSSPELSKLLKEVIAQVEGSRGMAKTATGIDPASDVTDATMCVRIVPHGDPQFVVAVRGKLTLAVIDKIATLTHKQAIKVGGGVMVETGGSEPAIAITKDGVLLAGTPSLIRDRLANSWKAPARAASSSLGYAQEAINAKPVFSVVVALSAAARKELTAKMAGQPKNFVSDVAGRHKAFAFSMFHDGIGWTWLDSTKNGLDQMAVMSEGLIEILRASQIAPRGIAKIALGALESYKGNDKRLDEVIQRKADIMKIVESYTGDGNFKATVNKDPKTLRLDVRATGKSLSEVVPAGFVGPGTVVGLLVLRGGVPMVTTPAGP